MTSCPLTPPPPPPASSLPLPLPPTTSLSTSSLFSISLYLPLSSQFFSDKLCVFLFLVKTTKCQWVNHCMSTHFLHTLTSVLAVVPLLSCLHIDVSPGCCVSHDCDKHSVILNHAILMASTLWFFLLSAADLPL